jgi:hypothetical protein
VLLQDRMLHIGKLIDEVRKNGGVVTNENDVYLREALYSGRVDEQINSHSRDLFDPLAKAMRALTVTEANATELKNLNDAAKSIMEEYKNHKLGMSEAALYALHAKERNAEMGRRNARFRLGQVQQTEGSGMTDNQADEILNWFASKPFGAKFLSETDPNSVRSLYRKIIASTNDVRVAGGLNPDFRTMTYDDGSPVDVYKDYAPIRGFLQEHPSRDNQTEVFARTGKGFNVRGAEDPSATGRGFFIDPTTGARIQSLGRDLIANAILQNEEAIIRAEKNKVDNAFYKLLTDNPAQMHHVATEIHQPITKWTYNKTTGNVQRSADPTPMNDPNVLKFKVDGQQKMLEIHDPRMARAMGMREGLGDTGMDAVYRASRAVVRVFSNLVTSLNPEFTVKNLLRDLITVLANLTEVEANGVRGKIIAGIGPAFQGVRRALRSGDRTSEWAKVFEEFQQVGGRTAFQGISTFEDSINKVNRGMQLEGEGTYLTKSWGGIKAVGQFVEDYNLAVENATRLSVYKNLRDLFLSQSSDPTSPANIQRAKERAAFMAKRMTVDFNMGGEMKPVLSALYMFYNASLQGSMAMINPLIRSRKMKYVWGSVVTAGVLGDMLNAAISPEDDDGEKIYDKIPDYVLEHNLVLVDPFGITERGYFKIPLPYGLNGIYNAGRAVASGARGKYSPGEAINSSVATMFNSFNPLGEANNWLNYVLPTVLDPVAEIALNKDYTGAPIIPAASPYGPDEVASQRYWNNTSPAAVTIADWLSRLTGRTGDFIPGYVEVSPNHLSYAFEYVFGGMGTFVMRGVNLTLPEGYGGKGVAQNIFTGNMEDVDINDIPFVRSVVGNITTKNDLQNYIKGRDTVLMVRKALQDARKDGDSAAYTEIMKKYPDEYRVQARVNAIENARKKLSTKIKRIRESKRIPEDKKEEMVKAMKERQDHLVGIGNRTLESADID